MTNERRWTEVNSYFAETLIGPDAALEATLAANAAAGLPSIDVSAPQGKLIHLLARMSGARRALEIGTLGGYSTIWLARALPDDGRSSRSKWRQTCRCRAPQCRPRRSWRQSRDQNRRSARDVAQDRSRGTWAVRLRLHRRRQDEQRGLSRMGFTPLPARNNDHGRQCGAGGRGGRRGEQQPRTSSACAACSN